VTTFIASIIAREKIGDPTTMLAQGRLFSTGASSSTVPWLLFLKWPRKKHAQEGLEAMDTASRRRRLFLHAVQTHCGIEGYFGNHDGGERLVGLE
jgi:hypothetical protein